MRLIVNIEAGNLIDVEETAPGHFRARMKPEAPSVYPYPTHQLCWFIGRFEGIAAGGEACELTLVNCEWNPDAFRTMRPFLCYETDWQRSTAWSHEGLVGMQLDSTRSESTRSPRTIRPQPAPAAVSVPATATPTPTPAAAPVKAKAVATPGQHKRESATLSLFPPPEEALATAAQSPAGPAVATAVPTPAAQPATAALNATTTPATVPPGGMSRDFTSGSMTYRFFLKSDCTIALHPPYTAEMLKTDLERWGMSPHLHYQRLGASHGGKSFFVVEAARHRAKGINPALPFWVLLAREHGAEPAVNWVVRGLIDRLLAGDGHPALDRLRLVLFPFINQDGAHLGMTVDPHTGLDVGNDFGRGGGAGTSGLAGNGVSATGSVASDTSGLLSAGGSSGGGDGLEFKLPEARMIYRYVADQIRAGRHCLGAISLHQPHGGQENIWPVYYLGPGRNCLDPALTAFQRSLHRHTRPFTHATADFWPLRVSVGRFDHEFGIPGVTLEINPHCSRNPLGVAGLEALGAALADTLAGC